MKTTVVLGTNGYSEITDIITNILKKYNPKKRNDLHYIRLSIDKDIVIIIKMLRCIDSDSSIMIYVYSIDMTEQRIKSLISGIIPYENDTVTSTAIASISEAIANITLAYASSGEYNKCYIYSYTGDDEDDWRYIYRKEEIKYDRKKSFDIVLSKNILKYVKQLTIERAVMMFDFSFAINQDDPVYKAQGKYKALITYSGKFHQGNGENAYSLQIIMPEAGTDYYDFVTYDELCDILVDRFGGLFGAINNMLLRDEEAHLDVYVLHTECYMPVTTRRN